jgi:hypothetical protein
MSSSKKMISKRLLHNQYAVLLDETDQVTVSRVAKLSLNKPFVQNMTLGEALRYGAWDTQNDSMSVDVQYQGAEIFQAPDNQYWAIITLPSNPLSPAMPCIDAIAAETEQTAAAYRAATATERDTVYFGYGF